MECVDNDETAAVITQLVGAENSFCSPQPGGHLSRPVRPLHTDRDGLWAAVPRTSTQKDRQNDTLLQRHLRDGSNGASAKLQFAKEALSMGTTVMIAHARHRLRDIMSGKIPCTVLRVGITEKRSVLKK